MKKKKINYIATAAALLIIIAVILVLQKGKVQPGDIENDINANIDSIQPELNENKQDEVAGISEAANEPNPKDGKYPKAPDFVGIGAWINSEPLSISQLKGKVVLVDFWTYTCINCIRTLPYIKEWDKKYRDSGLVIVGVHTPEFEFEKKYENVFKAINDYQLKYPVAQDNDYATWRAYKNRYWPHKFLIDIDGYIRYDHIGEGSYAETEKIIQELLNERMERMNEKKGFESSIITPEGAEEAEFQKIGTPEIYFGYQFDRGNLGYDSITADSIVNFSIPQNPYKNFVYLNGQWKYNADNMELVSDEGEIFLIYEAKKINMVAGSDSKSDAYIFLDGNSLNDSTKGDDIAIKNGKSTVDIGEFKLYNIASAEDYETHMIEIQAAGKGFKIYTFTFG